MKPEIYLLRRRILDDLGAAESEMETMEAEPLTKTQKAHLRASLDKVRKALCTTLVLGMEERA